LPADSSAEEAEASGVGWGSSIVSTGRSASFLTTKPIFSAVSAPKSSETIKLTSFSKLSTSLLSNFKLIELCQICAPEGINKLILLFFDSISLSTTEIISSSCSI